MPDDDGSASPIAIPWWADRRCLLAYRLRAAQLGLQVRSRRPFSDVNGIVGLAFGVFLAVLPIFLGSGQAWLVVLLVLVLAAWPAVRYLGSLGVMMRVASSSEEGAAHLVTVMSTGMGNDDGYLTLRNAYLPLVAEANSSLAERDWALRLEPVELTHPTTGAATRYASLVLRTAANPEPESILGRLSSDGPDTVVACRKAAPRQRLMARWRGKRDKREQGEEIGDNYCVAGLRLSEDGSHVVYDVAVASYGEIARSCEALVNEFALFAYILGRCRPPQKSAPTVHLRPNTLLGCLPWRASAHRREASAVDLLLSPRTRAAGLGFALATISPAPDSDEQCVFLSVRSETVGTYPKVLHIIPAGNCNTHGTHRAAASSVDNKLPSSYLTSLMKCEYLEEWHSIDDLEDLRIPDWEYEVGRLWSTTVRQLAPITLAGVAIDLVNLRPEICGRVEVAFTRTEHLNWEWSWGDAGSPYRLQEVGRIPARDIVQAAAAALLLLQPRSLD
jgi:hypothetical protein